MGKIIGEKGAAALAKEKDNAKKLPDLVPVFDMQSKSQKLVAPEDIEKQKGRYLRIKPAAAPAAALGTAALPASPVPDAKTTATPLPAEVAAAPVPSKDSSVEIIEEHRDSKSTAKKPTAKKEPKEKPKARQYYTGNSVLLTINGKYVVMTEEVFGLYEEYKKKTGKEIPITSNIRTEAEQEQLRKEGRYDEKRGWLTKQGLPIGEDSRHFMGTAIDVSTILDKDMAEFLTKNGWYRPLPTSDPVHWIKNPNFKPETEASPLPQGKASAPAVPAAPASTPVTRKLSYNTLDATTEDKSPTSLASNDVMTGLRLKQISSLNMDQKKRNSVQPIVLVNNTTTIIGSTKKETTSIPTDPDYNAYSPYAA